nr:MAG TPA: replication protein P [Caudoviricetes sp.]
MDKKQNRSEIIKQMAVLFGAYGQAADIDRQKIYVADLSDFPAELIGAACKKLRYEAKFLPTISEIVEAAKSLTATSTGKRLPTWLEAQQEIETQIRAAGTYKSPVFSCKEIEQAVRAYGWLNICLASDRMMPTIWVQLRKNYEQYCWRKQQDATNSYVLQGRVPCLLDNGLLPIKMLLEAGE